MSRLGFLTFFEALSCERIDTQLVGLVDYSHVCVFGVDGLWALNSVSGF